MLEKQDYINLTIKKCSINQSNDSLNQPILTLIINNKKVCIDVADGYNNLKFIKKHIKDYDYYFKRSYSEKVNKKYGFKMIPYGLNYAVYNKELEKQGILTYSFKNIIKKMMFNMIGKKNYNQIYLEDIECNNICIDDPPKILFSTRLWEEKEGGNDKINQMRIDVVRKLKKKYGNNFYGGIYDNRLARQLCPDLIINKLHTLKYSYLNIMKKCDICITTSGLYDSIGWKFAEYVIASKAILTEKLNYHVPGDFSEGKNYLVFEDANDCVNKVECLLNNKDEILKMMNNNHKYYLEYLRPDVQVKRMIDYVINDSV